MHRERQPFGNPKARKRKHAIRQEITAQTRPQRPSPDTVPQHSLEQNHVNQLSKQQPRIILQRQLLRTRSAPRCLAHTPRKEKKNDPHQTSNPCPSCPPTAPESNPAPPVAVPDPTTPAAAPRARSTAAYSASSAPTPTPRHTPPAKTQSSPKRTPWPQDAARRKTTRAAGRGGTG